MPWTESRVHDRIKFIEAYVSKDWKVTDLCRQFGISPKTGYKWIRRYLEEGVKGLHDRSRARHNQPNKTPDDVERRIVAVAEQWNCWGPRKLRAILMRRHPDVSWPARSTIHDILKRHGLVKPCRSRRRHIDVERPSLVIPQAPNELWCTDFKGWMLAGDNARCEPFVLNDAFSRYSLACELVRRPDDPTVWPIFERAFREYGLPVAILSDNGPPFASPRALGGLSQLSVRWLRLGIRPQRIEPGKPYQNGGLERFNLTVKLEAMNPVAPTWEEQARELRRFQTRYNQIRPHQALDDRTPADVFEPSWRPYPKDLPPFEYPDSMIVRSVHPKGYVKWAGKQLFLSEAIGGQLVGFQQYSQRHWSVRLGPLEIALYDDETREVVGHNQLVWIEDEELENP